MAFVRLDRVRVNTSTSGTGTLTLGSALAAYRTFANGGVANGDTVRYLIEQGADWEVGLGTYSTTGPTLTRTLLSSSTGSLISLSGAGAFVSAIVSSHDFSAVAALIREVLTADGTATTTLTNVPSDPTSVTVFAGGAVQSTGWSITGRVITWTGTPPASGDKIVVLYLNSTAQVAGVSKSYQKYTGGGTSFTLPVAPLNEAAIDVYIGGIFQPKDGSAYSFSGVTLTTTEDIAADDLDVVITNPQGIGVAALDTVGWAHFTSGPRRVVMMNSIFASRGMACSSTVLNMFATGFKGSTDALNGVASKTNATLDSTNGRMLPSTTDTYTTINDATFGTDNNGAGALNVRQQIATTAYSVGVNGDRLILTFKPSSTAGMTLSNVYVGHKGASAPDFDGNQVRVTFSGGNTCVMAANTAVASDPITFAFDQTKDLIVAFDTSNFSERFTTPVTGQTQWTKAGTGEAALTTASGYASGAGKASVVDLVQVRTLVTTNNQTITFDTQTVDSTGRVVGVLPIQEVDSLGTLGTNLTVEYQIAGGSWNNCTLVDLGAMKIGSQALKLLGYSVANLTPGTTVAVRYKTLNNKDLRAWGIAYDASSA